MSSIANIQYIQLRSLEHGKKTINTTYTVKVGSASDGFMIDNPVVIDDPEADFTVTVPSGEEIGQEVFIVLESNTNSKTATVSCTNSTGANLELTAATDYCLLKWTGAEWAVISEQTT
jgi:hypothetical protein